jgi:hypothetical protein
MLNIDDLLNALENPEKITLENTLETWKRIANDDQFEELGLDKGDLEEFLQEWMADNDYNNI